MDGAVRYIKAASRTFHEQNGKARRMIGTNIDITERKLAEEALRESEEKYRSIINASPLDITISDLEGRILMVSPMALTFFGYKLEDEMIGHLLTEFIIPEDHERALANITLKLQGIKTGPAEYRGLRQDGSSFDLEANADLIRDASGQPNKIVIIVIDITERKKAEDERRIMEERLQQADKMESIGRLAGGIAHDFNNLLMGIQGYASLTKMNLVPSHPNYKMLKLIEDQVQSGADLTRQLLGFARGGRYEIKSTDMNETIEKTSSMFGRTKKEISIHLKQAKDLWSVEVDRGQIEQVFVNLYVNAWQAMPGGGKIYLETENVILSNELALLNSVNPGKYVKIMVTDTGTGMDEKIRARIFDPFFTTKEMGRGTGLGLATVNGIIRGHRGIINVYSEPGHGTIFTIYLPASEKEVVKEKTATSEIIKGTETILLVDDEKMVLVVNRKLLESLGYRVYSAGSGQDAISVCMEKQNEIDLVILDMIMPGISGAELIDRLREISSSIRILLTSGYSIDGEAQKIMERGCSGFLQKPFQLEQLSSKVRGILD
jgi:PAS domain S-box-containing protein